MVTRFREVAPNMTHAIIIDVCVAKTYLAFSAFYTCVFFGEKIWIKIACQLSLIKYMKNGDSYPTEQD